VSPRSRTTSAPLGDLHWTSNSLPKPRLEASAKVNEKEVTRGGSLEMRCTGKQNTVALHDADVETASGVVTACRHGRAAAATSPQFQPRDVSEPPARGGDRHVSPTEGLLAHGREPNPSSRPAQANAPRAPIERVAITAVTTTRRAKKPLGMVHILSISNFTVTT
jgi:hypothetical protein